MATNVKSIRQIAVLQDRDISRVVSRSSVLASRVWHLVADTVRNRNTADYLYAEELKDSDEAVVEELLDLTVYAYLLRIKLSNRRRSYSKHAKIELASSVNKEIRKIGKQVDINLDNIRAKFEPTVRTNVKASSANMRRIVNDALQKESGKSFEEATKGVLNRIRKFGLQPRQSSYVETLVRTHASISYNAAHFSEFEGDPDLWGFEYVTMDDERVREEHELLHGTRRKFDDDFWSHFWPPNGWNCRCQAVAIYQRTGLRQTPVPKDATIDDEWDFNPIEFLE
jgi:SPP1 gp7 family putative phage head morphogenesis protein